MENAATRLRTLPFLLKIQPANAAEVLPDQVCVYSYNRATFIISFLLFLPNVS